MNKMCRTTNQSGRSMIEMLGVLAIIGVLSVGGIAGYSKAMMKFKINKTIDQISQMAQNTRTLYARQRNYGSLNGKIAYKANLAPKEMFESGSGSGYSMTNAWGGSVYFQTAGKNYDNDKKAFTIILHDLPEEACIELATQDWGSTGSGLISVGVGRGSSPVSTRENCAGESSSEYAIACSGVSEVSVPMPIDVAVDACSQAGTLFFKFY